MPSPFPGMDPFIESQRFVEFHSLLCATIAELLIPAVRPRYTVDVDRYVYLTAEVEQKLYRPDVSLAETADPGLPATHTTATLKPKMYSVPAVDEESQPYLTIRTRDDRKVVTMIELLSPINKRSGEGIQEYMTKRANFLRTLSSVVEIDLLRGGSRLPTEPEFQHGDYVCFVIRHGDHSHVEGYSWMLEERLPVIPIPLLDGTPDVGLDLQRAFDLVFDRHGYDYALDYSASILPPVDEPREQWIRTQLTK